MTFASRTTRKQTGSRRRGIAAVWLILSVPLFLVVLGMVLNVGFLWIARAELENAASSGALAGTEVLTGHHKHDDHHHNHGNLNGHGHSRHGHNHASKEDAVKAAKDFVAANFLHGRALIFTDANSHQKKHDRNSCRISVVIGTVKSGEFFPAGEDHGKSEHHHGHGKDEHHDDACLVTLSCPVDGPFGWLCGPRIVHVNAVAVIGEHGTPRLVEIHRVHRDN